MFFRVDSRTIYLYAFMVGLLTGAVAIAFSTLIHFLSNFLFDRLARLPLEGTENVMTSLTRGENQPYYILVLLIPAFGGLLVGLCTRYLDADSEGTGVDHLLDSFHNHSGQLRRRTPFVKFLTSVFTISSGGSAGKEGPMALIGAGLGSFVGKITKMGARAKRTLLLTGSAGGLGAIFRAPLGGAITAVEVLYKEDFETDALLPCIISSVTAYTVYSSVTGFSHHIQFDTTIFHSPVELIFYVFLGLFCSGAGFIFIRIFRGMKEKVFQRLKVNKIFLPAIGGLMVGLIGIFLPHAIGEGMGVIQGLIDGNYPDNWMLAFIFFLALAFLKMLATSSTLQSGGSGGVLIPSLFIGALLGGAFGTVCHHFFPESVPSVTPYIVVGMAAFFSSVTNASLGALVMVTEMTGGYELLPPLMTVAVVSLITSHKWSIYKNQVPNKFSSQAHLWDMNPRNLEHVKIRGAFHYKYHRRAVIPHGLSLQKIEKLMKDIQQTDFLVESEQKELIGIICMRDFAGQGFELKDSKEILVAQDLINRQLFYVTENDSLYRAMKFLTDSDFDKVPVVREEGEKLLLLGYLRHQDVVQYYYGIGLQHEKPAETDTPSEDPSADR